jgi:pilus assembly protein Flp/PilA
LGRPEDKPTRSVENLYFAGFEEGGEMLRFFRDTAGATSAEYALLLSIVGVGIGGAAVALGSNVQAAIGNTANRIHAVHNAAAVPGQTPGNDPAGGNGNGNGNGPPSSPPGQDPGPGNGNSNGNQSPGTPPGKPKGK